MAGNVAQISVGFARSVLLARLLSVETFGIYGWAQAITTVSTVFSLFGFREAFIHRGPETQDEDHAAAVQFTLQFALTLIWATVLVLVSLFLVTDQRRRFFGPCLGSALDDGNMTFVAYGDDLIIPIVVQISPHRVRQGRKPTGKPPRSACLVVYGYEIASVVDPDKTPC